MTDFIHFEEAGDASLAPILLLHGTGGDEKDLVPLIKRIAPNRSILSPRGKVSEGGMNRFFRRFDDGRFDEADIHLRANDLADFIAAKSKAHGWTKPPIALGFSNGANIAAALLYLRPEVLGGAVLLRAMVPLQNDKPAALAGKPVLLISGTVDPYMPTERAIALAKTLESAGANMTQHILQTGHGLTQNDLQLSHDWLEQQA